MNHSISWLLRTNVFLCQLNITTVMNHSPSDSDMDSEKSNSKPIDSSNVSTKDWKNYSDLRRKRLACEHTHRVGPAPRDEISLDDAVHRKEIASMIGSLDTDMDPIGEDTLAASPLKTSASSKSLLIYFAKMATNTNTDRLDYSFLDTLLQSGAEVNVSDKHGQTVLHEVARNWNTDVAKYFLEHGADVNYGDKWGRTPLHLAAAVNHSEMVQYLIQNGGDPNARTKGEEQCPIHYAAKYNAVSSLKVLIDNKVDSNDLDYKQRTPLFLAAEVAQEDAARYLIDLRVPAGVFDDTGMSAVALLIEKMPHIALDALNQFHSHDAAFRKESFHLNYLECDPDKWQNDSESSSSTISDSDDLYKERGKYSKRLKCPTTALKIAVQHSEYKVIMHPVMQQLIKTKWNLYGKIGASIDFTIHLIYVIIWTILGILLPRNKDYYEHGLYWRAPTELIGVFLTLFFIMKQIWERKVTYNEAKKFRLWRIRQLKRDLEFCHPRWSQEKTFLLNEMKNLNGSISGLLGDPWNIMEIFTYLSVILAIVTRINFVLHSSDSYATIHTRAYTCSLLFMWIHFMKSCRPFTTLGSLIIMFVAAIKQTLIFSFLFFEFMIPYTVGFWILFGGKEHAKEMENKGFSAVDWRYFNDLAFSVWQITLHDRNFNFTSILAIDDVTAKLMVGSFYCLCSLVCLNLHIAILTKTFREIYNDAKAHASQVQAATVLSIEKLLYNKRLKEANDCIQTNCAPLVISSELDTPLKPSKELWDRTIRIVVTRLNKLKDYMKTKFVTSAADKLANNNVQVIMMRKYLEEKKAYNIYENLLARDKQIYDLMLDIYELRCSLLSFVDGKSPLPSKPKHNPLPYIDLKPPALPLALKELLKKSSNGKTSVKLQTDNEIFRAIMNRKSVVAVDEIPAKEESSKYDVSDATKSKSLKNEDQPNEDSDFEAIEMDEI